MFESFKRNHARSKGLVQIGNSLDYLSIQLKMVLSKIELSAISDEEIKFKLLFLTHFQNIEVINRIDEFEWPITTKLLVPNIAGLKWITLGHAIAETVVKINTLTGQLGLNEEVQEIINKGPLYVEMQKIYVQVLKASNK